MKFVKLNCLSLRYIWVMLCMKNTWPPEFVNILLNILLPSEDGRRSGKENQMDWKIHVWLRTTFIFKTNNWHLCLHKEASFKYSLQWKVYISKSKNVYLKIHLHTLHYIDCTRTFIIRISKPSSSRMFPISSESFSRFIGRFDPSILPLVCKTRNWSA